ncbi:MAG: hypothetical protein KBS66_05210 [Eubacterium sp.]|nr:hypothetical protein [Candidatus Colimonas fimequi]
MELIIALGIFICAVVACLLTSHSVVFALMVGFVVFAIVGIRMGNKPGEVMKMAAGGAKDAMIVVEIVIMIGFMTGLWRASGTITFFVYYGISVMTPSLFILIAFIMCLILAYVMGNSFGTVGTMGLMLMAIAHGGNVDPIVTAGAIVSAAYFGDRTSPMSSTAILVANITHVDLMELVPKLMKTNIIPLLLCFGLYTFLSFKNPIQVVDDSIMNALATDFSLSPLTLIPVIFAIALPILRFDIRWAFICGIISSAIIAIAIQGASFMDVITWSIMGYTPDSPSLQEVISGGGFIDMWIVAVMVTIACSISGIFKGTNMLNTIQAHVGTMMSRLGRFVTTLIMSTLVAAIFCSQTIAVMLSKDLLQKPFNDNGGEDMELAVDLSNAGVLTSAVVPWNVAIAVPLAMLGVGPSAIAWAFYLYLVPIIYIFTKRFLYKK